MTSIRSRVLGWRDRKWREVFPNEGVLVSGARDHAWAAALRPVAFVGYAREVFKRTTVLPGDVFFNVLTLTWFHVREVRHDYVIAEAFAQQALDAIKAERLDPRSPNCWRVYERVPKPLPRMWWRSGSGDYEALVREIAS